MSIDEFVSSLKNETPPELNSYLIALWYDGKGDWNKAHDLIDPQPGEEAARIHAYLHRKEGDSWNADYWYQRANAHRPQHSLEEEWTDLVTTHLAH